MQYLRADSITEVTIGPAVAVGDGFTPVITLSIAGADEAEIIKHGATATVGIAGTLAAITNADGYYALDLSATDTDTEGRLTLLINDDSLILPIRMEFMVVAANVFDSLFAVAGTDLLQIDQTEIVGTTVPTPTTAGVPDVNVERWLDTLVTLSGALPDVNVEAMDANSIAAGVMAANSIGVTAMAAGSIAAGTIAAGELTNIEDEIWDALKSAHVVANSFGDFLDIEISSRLASADINLTGGAVDVVTAVTNAVTVGTINANVINAASIAATAMNDKGNWNIGKTGYALTQTFPANFADLSIVVTTGLVDITQTAADKVWATAARILTASTNFNDIAATDIVSAGAITTLAGAVVNVDTVDSVTGAVGSVSGNVDGSVGSIATGGIVATSFAAGAINAAAIATDAIDADALATSAVDKIREAILPKQNEAFTFTFLFVAASDHVTPVTGATGITDFRSIDGAAFVAGGATVTEVGNGIYEYAATTGDMNGGVITFRFAATGGTPGAPDDAFVEIVTSGGV
jgi:hypothetical protein